MKYAKLLTKVFTALLFIVQPLYSYNIGLCITATGKYMPFALEFIASARKFFCTKHNVTYFIFTDKSIPVAPDIQSIRVPHRPWPDATLMRVHGYYTAKEYLEKMDYVFASDADMLFVSPVGDEILSERVATLHPGFYKSKRVDFSYEKNKKNSTAFVHPHEGTHYFAGGFYGGTAQEFLSMTHRLIDTINMDKSRGVLAEWHDESHLNRYFIDNKPTLILSPSYCYWEGKQLFDKNKKLLPQKLVARNKDHKQYQL